jgi:hypothetical protein
MASLKDIDISKLSASQKLFLYDWIQEKKRRQKEKRAVYKPNEGQNQVHKSETQTRVVISGNGSGKTALATNEALWRASGWNPIKKVFTPVPATVIMVLDNPSKVEEVFKPEIEKWATFRPEQWHKKGKPYFTELHFDNGSVIRFVFHLQELMSFESIESDFIIFDEPPPRDVFVALKRSGRKKHRQTNVLFVGTPIAQAWMRKELVEPAMEGTLQGVEIFKFGTKVNEKNLSKGYIEEFSRFLSEKEKRIRLEGDFFDLDGLALAHLFDRTTHIVRDTFDKACPVVIAIDPHTSKPNHACMLGVDRDNYFYYLKELKSKTTARQFARELKEWYKGYRVIDVICDSAGNAEMSGGDGYKSFIQILKEEGVQVRPTSFSDKDDEDFIQRIQDALLIPKEPNALGQHIPKLRIMEGNGGIVNDIENVNWLKIKNIDEFKPKLDIQNKDFLACLKYALATNLFFKKQSNTVYKPIKQPTSYGISKRGSPRIGLKPR